MQQSVRANHDGGSQAQEGQGLVIKLQSPEMLLDRQEFVCSGHATGQKTEVKIKAKSIQEHPQTWTATLFGKKDPNHESHAVVKPLSQERQPIHSQVLLGDYECDNLDIGVENGFQSTQ